MMAKRKRTPLEQAVAVVVEGERDPNAFHWADPLFPPFTDRRTPCGVGLVYEEWLLYTGNLMGTGLWQH